MATCISRLNQDLNCVSEWAARNKLSINPSKSQCLPVSKRPIDFSALPTINLNNQIISFVSKAKNLGVTFDNKLSWNTHISTAVGKVYGMLRTLWSQKHSTPFQVRLLLSKTYLVPTLLYGCELFSNCDSVHKRKLKVLFNNIARYVFNRRRFQSISAFSKQIYGIDFDNLLKLRNLTLLHKIIYVRKPSYLFQHVRIARSLRGQTIILPRHSSMLSDRQFFLHSIRLWNEMPNFLQCNNNINSFKKCLKIHLASQ